MVDPAEETRFHWLAGDGTQLSGAEHTLRAALASGSLSAAALVWRAGWAEWLPANRVAELASAIPAANRESPLKPLCAPAVGAPSSAPAEHMPAVVPGAAVSAPPRTSPPAARAQPPPAPVRAKPSAPPAAGTPSSAPAAGLPPPPTAPASLPPFSPVLPTSAKRDRAVAVGPHEAARDTLAPSSFGVIGQRRPGQSFAGLARGEGAESGALARRGALPTLTEESGVPSATATLRPPGAVPPPARSVPAVPALDSAGSFSFEKRSAVMTPSPTFGPPGGAFETVLPAGLVTPAINEPAGPTLPPVMNQALLPQPAQDPSEAPLDSTLEVLAKVPPEALRTPIEDRRPPLNPASEDVLARALQRHSLVKIGRIAVDSRTVVMALSALSGALLVAVIALYVTRGSAPLAARSVTASTPPTPAPSPGCHVSVPAALIAPNVERSVPAYIAKVGNDPALALGFAASKTQGVGLRLNPGTLDALPAFEEEGKDAVRGVVPLTRSGTLAFFVDRDDRALRSAHTVDEIPPFTLGLSDAGFSRVAAGSTSLIWPLDANVKITEPRAAQVGSFGYGVAFRRGGQSGAVLLGFVASDGSSKSELVEIPGAPKFLGTPVIAGSASGALVAFAGRDAPEGAWKVFASLTPPGARAGAARELVTASGAGAISPTLSALGSDRWLVQWTEGISGQYHVRVQSFAADLSPIGQSVLVSPKGANAGQGSLGAFAGGAASLFILTTAGHDELWGATLSCP